MNTIDNIKEILLKSDFNKLKESLNNYNINEHDKFGNNILHYYITQSKNLKLNIKDTIDELLARGININEKQTLGQFKRSALQMSVVLNLKEIFDLLISKGAEVNSADVHGNSILNSAVFNYFKDNNNYGYYITELLKHGADPLQENDYGISSYSLANSISNNDVKKYFSNLPN